MIFDTEEINKRLDFFKNLLSCHSKFYLWTYDAQGYLMSANCDNLIINKIFLVSDSFSYLMEYVKEHREPLIMSSRLGLMWTAAFEYHKNEQIRRIHVLGPVFVDKPSRSEIEASLKDSPISLSWKPTFLKILDEIPVITTTSFFQQTIMLHYSISGEKLTTSDIVFQRSEKE